MTIDLDTDKPGSSRGTPFRLLRFDGAVSVANILAAMAIVISIVSLVVSCSSEQSARRNAEATEARIHVGDVRESAAFGLGRIDRLISASNVLYRGLSLFIYGSQFTVDDNGNISTEVARSYLSQLDAEFDRLIEEISTLLAGENVRNGYSRMVRYDPSAAILYNTAMAAYDDAFNVYGYSFTNYIDEFAADLRNRSVVNSEQFLELLNSQNESGRELYERSLETAFEELRAYFNNILALEDGDLLARFDPTPVL